LCIRPSYSGQPFHQNLALFLFFRRYSSVASALEDASLVVQHAMQNQPPAPLIKSRPHWHLIGMAARAAIVAEDPLLLRRSVDVEKPLRVTKLRDDIGGWR